MGSGGGAGGAGTLNSSSKSSGGAGGGLVHLSAEEIDLSGQIVADGGPGTAGSGDFLSDGAGGGGGGSGGSVWLSAPKLVLSSGSAISVAGGPSGAGAAGNNNGGAGAAGRIRIDADTLQGAQPSTPGSYRREAAGRLTLHTHDADNRPLDTVVGADSYDPAHTGTATGGANVRTRVQYDADGHVVARYEPRAFSASITNADPLFMTRTSYDADGRAVTRYVPRYDNGTQAADDLGAYSDPQSNGAQGAQCATGTTGYPASVGVCITRVTYDPAGNVSRAYLPTSNGADNRHLDYSYTADNLLASVSAPAPPGVAGPRVTAMTSAYDGDGKVISATDANGVQQLTTYYSDERVRTQTGTPNGGLTHVTQHGYDANGNSTSVTDAVGATSTTRYSADNLVTDSIDGAGDDTRYAYDPGGRTTQVYSPSAIAGDPGNPFVGSTGKGQPTVYTYTSDSLPLSVTTPVTVTTSGPTLQRQVTYGYDRGGRKTAQDTELTPPGTPSAQGTQSFSYYNDDRLATHGAENGAGTITTVYDPAGNPTSVVDTTSGSTVTATYYLDGRWRTVDDGSRQQRYAGDGAGRIVARADVVDGSGTTSLTSFTYGDAELPATMVAAAEANGTTSWGYDAGGRVTSESDPNGQSVALSYGPDGTLGSKLVSVGGSPTASWCYGAYDGDYRQKQQTFAAGACSGGVTDSYSYDGAGRVSSFQISGTATNPSIQWDHDGNRLSYTNGAATLTATYRADDSIAGGDTYDQFGRLTGDGCTTYGYDGFNRLTSATVASGGCNGRQAGTAHYTYDGLDRQVSHQDAGSSSTTAVHYDGLSSVGVIETPAGGADTLYALDPSGVHKALRSGSTPTYQYLTDDGYGNIGAVESSTGVTACADRFDPFATPQAAGSTPICAPANTADDYLYRGARQDQTTKDYQFGARTYDPAKAAFAMPDSYATAQPAADLSVGTDPLTANRYGYVNGDPVNLTDPTGHLAMHADAGCGGEDALALNDCQWQNPCRMGGHDCVDPDHIRYRDFLGTIKDAVTGCVTSFSGAATCAGVLAAPVAPEASAVLFAAAGVPSDINCVQTHDVGSCVSGGLSLLPGIAELSGPARGAVRGVLGSGEADALMQDAGKASGGVTTSPATGPPGSAVAPVALDAAAGGRAMLGKAVSPEARSLYTSPGYDPEAYLNSVANEAGINLRGVRITYDPTLPVGQPGLTLPQEAGWVIRIGPDALQPDAYAANTIAHELSHARYLQKYGSFEGEVHGHAFSFADGTPYGSGNALQAWWEGRL